MNCIITNVRLSIDDANQTFKSVITDKAVAKGDTLVSYLLASELENNFTEVINTANAYFEKNGIDTRIPTDLSDRNNAISALKNINKNQLKAIMRRHYEKYNRSIDNYSTIRKGKALGFFSSDEARTAAIEYVGNEIAKSIIKNRGKNKTINEITIEAVESIISEFKDTIMNDTITLIEKEISKFKENEIPNKYKSAKKRIKEYNELKENIKELRNKIIEARNNRDNSLYRELVTEYNEKSMCYQAFALLLVNDYGNVQSQNFFAMYSECVDAKHNKNNEFFDSVLSLNKVNSLSRDLARLKLSDIYNNAEFDTEEDFENMDNDDTNEDNTAAWDKGKVSNNYLKTFDADFKQFLSTECYILSEPYYATGNEAPVYERHPLLGTKQTYDGTELLNQLVKLAFDTKVMESVDTFINYLNRKSKTDKYFYGITPLITRMREVPGYANLVYKNLSQYKVEKFIATLSEDGSVDISRNNPNLFAESKEYNILMSGIRNNFDELAFDYSEELRKAEDKDKLKKVAVDILKNIAPNYNTSGIIAAIDAITDVKDLRNIKQALSNILTGIVNSKTTKDKAYSAFHKQYVAWRKSHIGSRPVFNKVEASGIQTNNLVNKGLSELIKYILPYSKALIELNSVNAENHQSSNIISNSHISNLVETIKGTNTAGLLSMARIWRNVPQVKDNPFFFGIRDNNGKLIVPGLFIENIDGTLAINEDFKDNFNVYLFDGIKTEDGSQAVTYDNATKQDYFFTQLCLFVNQGIKSHGQTDVRGLTFMLDTPSDSLKNYAMTIPGLELNNLFEYDTNDVIAVFRDKFSDLNKYVVSEEVNIANVLSDTRLYNVTSERIKNILDLNNSNVPNINVLSNMIFNRQKVYNGKEFIKYKEDGQTIIPIVHKMGDKTIVINFVFTKDNNSSNGTFSSIKSINVLGKVELNGTQFAGLEKTIPNEFIQELMPYIKQWGYKNGKIKRNFNVNNQLFLGYKQILKSELNSFVSHLKDILEVEQVEKNGKILYKVKTDNTGLITNVHHKKGKLVKDGRLTGNFFHFDKLFACSNYNVNEVLNKLFNLYGNTTEDTVFFTDTDGNMYINDKASSILNLNITKKDGIINSSYKMSPELDAALNNVVNDWLNAFMSDIENELTEYNALLEDSLEQIGATYTDVTNFVLATSYARLATEPLFSGDSKFYNKSDNYIIDENGIIRENTEIDSRTFLKRSKEVQAGGQIYYGGNIFNEPGTDIHNITQLNKEIIVGHTYINGVYTPIYARNGFRGVTIKNTIRGTRQPDVIQKQLAEDLDEKVKRGELSRATADRLQQYLSNAFIQGNTKVNDAQSYITFEEWMRRRWADGTIYQYTDLINAINDVRSGKKVVGTLNLSDINTRIQVQKNFYFDIQKDGKTNTMYPRQIKNAEFVIIPELVKGTDLEKLYNVMVETGIDQINTIETSKAANREVLEYWDDDEVANASKLTEGIRRADGTYNTNAVENYYYRNLWKQQDVPEHIMDEENKAGLQFTKKVIDNANEEVRAFVDRYVKNFVANIQESYYQMIYNMGWKINENGRIVNRKDNSEILDFTEFYIRAKQEAERLGMDSNFKEYFELDDITKMPKMPNYLNLSAEKQESIAQALFNSGIRRQTLPGWHAAQVSGVGTGVIGTDGVSHKLKYRHSVDENGNETREIEILLPRWSNSIPKYVPREKREDETDEEYLNNINEERKEFDKNILKKLAEKGLDKHIIYRIPTEGKQSIAVAKIVGFIDESLGSTVIVPNEWVTQTGSDFDVDSIYAVCKEFFYNEKTGEFVLPKENKNKKLAYIRYIKRLVESDRNSSEVKKISEIKRLEERLSNLYKELYKFDDVKESYNKFNGLLNSLESDLQRVIKTNMKKVNEAFPDEYAKRDDYYVSILTKLSKSKKLTEEEQKQVSELINIIQNRMNYVSAMNNINETLDDEVLENNKFTNAIFDLYSDVVKEFNLMTFDEFNATSEEFKESRKYRNNEIVDNIISIMTHPSSTEENLSRSNFDDITAANELIRSLQSESHNTRILSTANTLSQIQFFVDAIMGARLKARSVQRDTFLSICNKLRPRLKNGVFIAYPIDMFEGETREEKIANARTLGFVYDIKDNKIIFEHSKFGWNSVYDNVSQKEIITNRNVLGRLLTTYSSETTAHILDAVKEGAIFNETEDTFSVFKTLVDIGTDYETAIAFLAQPVITKLVKAFNSNSSIYISDSTNAIKSVFVDILNRAGDKDVSIYHSYKTIFDRAKKLFGFSQNDLNKYANDIILDKEKLLNDVKGHSSLKDEFDVIAMFYRLYNIGKQIDNLINVSNPDKFGAKQTIHETKRVLQNIYNYGFNESTAIDVFDIKGTNFIEALYPGFTSEDIEVEHSLYPQLAAFLKYCTIPSVEIDSKLFTTEAPAFSSSYEDIIRLHQKAIELKESGEYTDAQISQILRKEYGIAERLEATLGKQLTKEEYAKFKKYIISSVFNENETLLTPITIDESGRFVPFTGELVIANKKNDIDNDNAAPQFNYWNNERTRIFGFGVTGYNNITVKDITNPTQEEIEAFARLTPAQKVDWIKLNFRDNAGIFNYIVTDYEAFGSRVKYGINTNSIYVEPGHDAETLYDAFRNSAFNRHPFSRLACADLVKYAFIVEGFNFKANSISRIITNDFLYNDKEHFGFTLDEEQSLIDQFNHQIRNINQFDYTTEDFIDRFIRQNYKLVKEIKFNSKPYKKNQLSEQVALNSFVKSDDSIFIPTGAKDSINNFIINKIIGNINTYRGYVRFKLNPKAKSILYKVKYINNNTNIGLYLYPIGTLEENEYNDYSVRNTNNPRFKKDYYEFKFDELEKNIIATVGTDQSVQYVSSVKEEDKVVSFTVPKYEYSSMEIDNFQNIIDGVIKNDKLYDGIKDLIEQINKNNISPVGGEYGVVAINNKAFNNIFSTEKDIVQTLIINDISHTYKISKYNNPSLVKKIGENRFKTKNNDGTVGTTAYTTNEKENAVIEHLYGNGLADIRKDGFNLYKVEELIEENEEINETINEVTEERQKLFAATPLIIGDEDESTDSSFNNVSKLAGLLAKNLIKQADKSDNKIAEKFSYRVNTGQLILDSPNSINRNLKSIYAANAEFFRQEAQLIMDRLEKYNLNGKIFAINDDEFYNELLKHPEEFDEVVNLILYAKNFGTSVSEVFEIDLDIEDTAVKSDIQSIRESINKVRNSEMLLGENGAIAKIFDIYLAKKFSTNPLVRHELVNLRTQFGDINWFDLNIADAGHLNNKQIQVVLKSVYTILDKARDIDAPDAVRLFQNQYDEILSRGNVDMNKLIDSNGKYIQTYKQEYLTEKERVTNDYVEAQAKYGRYSIQAQKAKLIRDKFFAKNVEQLLVKEYYDRVNNAKQAILDKASDYFVKYLQIQDELSELTYDNRIRTETDENRIKELHIELNNLLDKHKYFEKDEFGYIDPFSEGVIDEKAEALQVYIEEMKKINDEYKEHDSTESWKNTLEHYLQIIKDFDDAHPNMTYSQKMDNELYREATVWIEKNTIRKPIESVRKKMSAMFKALKSSEESVTTGIRKWAQRKDKCDAYGRIDGRKFTLEEQKRIAERYLSTLDSSHGHPYDNTKLIKRTAGVKPIYTQQFYEDLYGGMSFPEVREQSELINEINQIFIDAKAVGAGGIDMLTLFENLSIDKLRELKSKIDKYYSIKKGKLKEDDKKRLEAFSRRVVSNDAFNSDLQDISNKYKNINPLKTALFIQIFAERDFETKETLYIDGKPQPSYLFYGWRAPLESETEKYIDRKKEEARKWIDKNIEYVTNEYYREAKLEAIENGTYEEWFKANHIYNPFKQRYEPTPIWTDIRYIGDTIDNSYEYTPTYENSERNPKEKYRNKHYKKFGSRYKADTGEFTNSEYYKLNDNEKAMLELLTNTANKYVINNTQRSFNETYAPRLLAHKADKQFWKSVVQDTFGLQFKPNTHEKYHENIGYLYDSDPDFQMFEILKGKGSKERIKARARLEGETDEEYYKYLNDVKRQNKEIDEENLKIDNNIRNNNWRDVFSQLVNYGENYLARNKAKSTLYLLLQDLLDNNAYKLHWRTNSPIVDKSKSVGNVISHKITPQEHAFAIMQNFARRVIYDEYKIPHKFVAYANLIQGFTSAKYMMLNLHGGVANVSTGLVNIMGERFSGEYFSNKAWRAARNKYATNVLSFLGDIYSDDASTFTSGLLKLLNVVNYDEINGTLSKADDAVEFARKLNDFLFSPNSMGEHFMQNTVALAMIEDSRVYEDGNGGYKIGTINNYTEDLDIQTLKDLLINSANKYDINEKSIIDLFNKYIKKIQTDKAYQHEFDAFQKDICMEFINLITAQTDGTSELAQDFIKEREKNREKAKKEFESKAKLIDQFEFVKTKGNKGVTRIKHDSILNIRPSDGKLDPNIGNETFVQFSEKIKYVNKKIHGVYDKLGRAKIENQFWGSLVMQYHKHIYPGIMKRYRGMFVPRGYYNEMRQSVEIGSYTSLVKFLSAEFRKNRWGHKTSINADGEIVDTEISALESLQNVGHALIATCLHISTNWNMLPAWEQRNIKRAFGEIAGIVGTALLAILIYAGWDDDELKDNMLLANIAYTSSRMFSEAYMYLPTGLWSEFDSMWSSPIAGGSNIKDIMKATEILYSTLFDEEFEPMYTTGQYRGRSKLGVVLSRNIPIYRIYNSIVNMGAKNSYYNGSTSNSSAQRRLHEIGKEMRK